MATVVAVCFAMLQLGGRALFSQLSRFEGTINAMFGPDLVVQGLEGRWQGLNPGIFAGRVRLSSNELLGFDFELDLIESLGRNRVVARRMTIADGRLTFEKTGAGWHMEGASDGPAFDALALFAHSDEVWVRGSVFAREGRRTAALYLESWLINVAGRHRFTIRAQSEPNCTGCALVVEGDITENGPGVVTVDAQSFSLGSELDRMLGLPRFELALAAEWRRRAEGTGHARADIDVTGIGTLGTESMFSAKLGAWSERRGYRGRIESLSIAAGERSLRIGDVGIFIPEHLEGAFIDLWVPPFLAEEAAPLLTTALGTDHRIGRWFHNLAPRGRIDGLLIRVDREGAAFVCRGRDASIDAYQGVPQARNVDFVARGNTRAVRLDIDSYDVALAMPGFVAADETYLRGGGSLTFAFGSGNFGLRGQKIWLDRGGTRAVADIAVSRRVGVSGVQVTADAEVDRIAVAQAEEYFPLNIGPEIREWLQDNVRAGFLADGRLLFQGNVGAGSAPSQHFEMTARVVDGVVNYHPDWPTASRVHADLVVQGTNTSLRGSARVLDLDVADVDVKLPSAGGEVSLRLRSRADVKQLLGFVRNTPVRDGLPFLSDTWKGAGDVAVAAELAMPLKPAGDDEPLLRHLRLDFELEGADIDLVDLGLRFEALDHRVSYEWPHSLSSETLKGELFGSPVRIDIESDGQAIRFMAEGSATLADAYRVLDLANPGIADGRFDFNAVFETFTGLDHPAELRIESDLVGVSAMLPAPLDKVPNQARAMAVSLQFLDDYVAVSARYDELSGWLHVDDNGILAGALGMGVPVPMADASLGRVVVAGGLTVLDSSLIASLFGSAGTGGAGFGWELRDFRIGTIQLEALELADVRVDGYAQDGEIRLTLAGRDLHGSLERSGDGPWRLNLPELNLPAYPPDEKEPLDPRVIDALIAADVDLGRVHVGEEDYGTWSFALRPVSDGIELLDVVAGLRGLAIQATAPVVWSRDGTTRFEGSVTAGDLREVLPRWDFVPSVQSESFAATGSVHWPGSPLDFEVANLSGKVSLDLANGRFLDIEQGAGAARIMSLINFSTIVKRISLDFTDVFGRGLSFDRALADLSLSDGRAQFDGPAKISGTGLDFAIEGTVDFASGTLDSTMVVTLPLDASLPWYAALLAASNPLAAAGVLFGQQVLKDPIKRLLSVDVGVSGTFDDPQVVTTSSASTLAATIEPIAAPADGAGENRAGTDSPESVKGDILAEHPGATNDSDSAASELDPDESPLPRSRELE